VLDRWGHLEDIPADPITWDAGIRSASKLSAVLRDQWDLALLFRRIATVEIDAPVSGNVDDIEWKGPADSARLAELCGADVVTRAEKLAAR
jgi:hypothetical protein